MPEYLFVYGTLQGPELQLQLLERVPSTHPDSLSKYQIEKTRITDLKFIAKGENEWQNRLVFSDNEVDIIEGMVISLETEELKKIDNYEPENYRREKIKLASGILAWVYL
jgi:gamma-glutamylcyclotransferase (GGCT)/AIG2-like uncharacterized protein YtfP